MLKIEKKGNGKRAVKMSKKTIMLVCSAGMSTSLLVTKEMQKAAFNQGLDAHIFAASASEAETNLENNPVDVLLLESTSSLYEE